MAVFICKVTDTNKFKNASTIYNVINFLVNNIYKRFISDSFIMLSPKHNAIEFKIRMHILGRRWTFSMNEFHDHDEKKWIEIADINYLQLIIVQYIYRDNATRTPCNKLHRDKP